MSFQAIFTYFMILMSVENAVTGGTPELRNVVEIRGKSLLNAINFRLIHACIFNVQIVGDV